MDSLGHVSWWAEHFTTDPVQWFLLQALPLFSHHPAAGKWSETHAVYVAFRIPDRSAQHFAFWQVWGIAVCKKIINFLFIINLESVISIHGIKLRKCRKLYNKTYVLSCAYYPAPQFSLVGQPQVLVSFVSSFRGCSKGMDLWILRNFLKCQVLCVQGISSPLSEHMQDNQMFLFSRS